MLLTPQKPINIEDALTLASINRLERQLIMNAKSVILPAFFLIASQSIIAATNSAEIPHSATWQDFNVIKLSVEDNQNSWKANWLITIDKEKNTISIEKDDYFHNQNLRGTLIILAGKTMLSKGLVLRKGYEIDALDTPIIMMQLLFDILNKTLPSGPASITRNQKIEHSETNKPIHISTKSASAHFNAPWVVNGLFSRSAIDTIEYEFSFATSVHEDINYTLNMKGELHQKPNQTLDGTMMLEDWKIYQLGPMNTQQGERTSFHYGAQLFDSKASTLGELRKKLSR